MLERRSGVIERRPERTKEETNGQPPRIDSFLRDSVGISEDMSFAETGSTPK